VRNTRTRRDWIRNRAAELGPDLARALAAETGQGLLQYLEHRYWSRELTDLKPMLAEARQMFPAAYQASILSRRRIYPRWVYRLRDLVR
jgi:hypothetical protein